MLEVPVNGAGEVVLERARRATMATTRITKTTPANAGTIYVTRVILVAVLDAELDGLRGLQRLSSLSTHGRCVSKSQARSLMSHASQLQRTDRDWYDELVTLLNRQQLHDDQYGSGAEPHCAIFTVPPSCEQLL